MFRNRQSKSKNPRDSKIPILIMRGRGWLDVYLGKSAPEQLPQTFLRFCIEYEGFVLKFLYENTYTAGHRVQQSEHS